MSLARPWSRESLAVLCIILFAIVVPYIYLYRERGGGAQRNRDNVKSIFIARGQCSSQQLQSYVKYLQDNGGYSVLTQCPKEDWILDWRRNLPQMKEFISMEIGCNKGTDAILMLKMFTGSNMVNLDEWLRKTGMTNFYCAPDKQIWDEVSQGPASFSKCGQYRHFCIEPIRETYNLLKRAAAELKYTDLGLEIHQNAFTISDNPQSVQFSPIEAGIENVGIDQGIRSNVTYSVSTSTVDKFAALHKLRRLDLGV